MGTTMLSFSDRVVIETLHNEKRSLQWHYCPSSIQFK